MRLRKCVVSTQTACYKSIMGDFYQIAPELRNQFSSDLILQSYLQYRLPEDIYGQIAADCREMGQKAASIYWELENQAEAEPPVHIPYSAWGERVDEIRVSAAWQALHAAAAHEGLIAIGYERKFAEFSRLYQFAKLYLFHPSSAFYTCPLAMTDGAAKLIEIYGDSELKKGAFRNITSRDPATFWTSGQWMTEREGGSDVGNTATIARPEGDIFRLYGTKWFSSATTSDMAMALARIEGDPAGSKGLSVFYIEMRDAAGKLNQISINRLKDKLGTRALPTAELSLTGTPGKLVGKRGAGVSTIASLFNITRMYNSVGALSTSRRALYFAADYATKRRAFGRLLKEHPLHLETLAKGEVEHAAAFHLTMYLICLLGKEEVGKANHEEIALQRLLIPIAKLYTGKLAVSRTSESIEAIGGAAYVEDTTLPRLIRNAQVFPIWEGTTNVLCLDVLRAIEKEKAFDAFVKDLQLRLKKIQRADLSSAKIRVEAGLNLLTKHLREAQHAGSEFIQASAREFALALARVFAGSLLLEFAEAISPTKEWAIAMAQRYCETIPQTIVEPTADQRRGSLAIVYPENRT